MRAVVDTNVWVSAFLTPGGAPAELLTALFDGRLLPLFSTAIEAEYRAVLARPKFDIERQVLALFFEQLHAVGQREDAVPPLDVAVPDPGDAPFAALARYAGCPVITGNAKHFPARLGVSVMTPREWVAANSAPRGSESRREPR